jgi:ubiquitin carboxyl-terminal hydrolase MINDY-3/4
MESSSPHRLGGDSSSTNEGSGMAPLTPDEIRRRRLAAFDRVCDPTSLPSSVPTIFTTHHPVTVALTDDAAVHDINNHLNLSDSFPDEPDEVDEELQAALELSLQDNTSVTNTSYAAVSYDPFKESRSFGTNLHSQFEQQQHHQQQQQLPSQWTLKDEIFSPIIEVPSLETFSLDTEKIIQTAYATSQQLDNIVKYHELLWDDQLTTDSDKQRWVSQGIDVRNNTDDTNCISIVDATMAANEEQSLVGTSSSKNPWTTAMETIAASHSAWGLVQNHGGPCGVLAAIQAELLRTLLFSNSDFSMPSTKGTGSSGTLTVRTALARAIALVLARAALTPSNFGSESINSNENTKSKNASDGNSNSVRIVLPATTEGRALTWHDLEPWQHVQGSTVSTSSLIVYSIPTSLLNSELAESSCTVSVEAHASNDVTTSKRQKVVLPSDTIDSSSIQTEPVLMERIHRMAFIVEAFLLDETRGKTSLVPAPPLDLFRQQGGVLLLVLSLMASRTIAIVQGDFDDAVGTRLTGQFGHCGQELINLLLTGQAVSNVFDNTLSPSGDMVCRGIQSRPAIGYLTQLEAMRYCEVGGYYKLPVFPIWVVGSTSHFTVLFGDPASLKESKSDMLLDECRRAFKAVEGGEENGFIQTDQLRTVLKSLSIDIGGTNDPDESARMQALAASLEVSGASIILWDDFWKAASRLLTGASLEAVLHGGDGSDLTSPIIVDGADRPPPLLTSYAENPDMQVKPEARRPTLLSANVDYVESDQEMAQRLAAEWENEGVVTGMMALSSAAEVHNAGLRTTLMDVDQYHGAMGDEELARYLQDQYDTQNTAETAISGGEATSVAAINGSPFPVLSDTDETNSITTTPTHTFFAGEDVAAEDDFEDTKPAAQLATSTDSLPFEQYGDTFSLYHYNGLRGGVLTPFRITRLTAEEAVGASIALNRGTGVSSSRGSSGTQDLEDVVRTKWPSCAINWLGKTPPYID